MTFDELFMDDKEQIKYFLKTSDEWWHEEVQDPDTHELKTVIRCHFSGYDYVFHQLKKVGISPKDKFYVNGIGKLKYEYDPSTEKCYFELFEKGPVDIRLI